MHRRSQLYDTRTYQLENKDLTQGIIFALVALALSYFAVRNPQPWSLLLPATATYLGTLIASNRTRPLVPAGLAVGALLLPITRPQSFEILRLAVFAMAIGLTPKRKVSINSLFVLLGLWIALLASPLFRAPPMITSMVNAFHIQVAFLEILIFLLLLILLWSKAFPLLFGRVSTEVDLHAAVFALLFLATLGGGALALTGVLYRSGLNLQMLIDFERKGNTAYALLLMSMIAVPLALAMAIERLLYDFTTRIQQTLGKVEPGATLTPAPKIRDFSRVLSTCQDIVDEHDHRLREADIQFRNLAAQCDERIREMVEQLRDAQNLSLAMSLAPVGYIAVSGTGAILSSNETLDAQFSLNNSREQIGEHFASLKNTHPTSAASKERTRVLNGFLARIIAEHRELPRQQALQSFAPLDADSFAQFTVYLLEGELFSIDPKRISTQIAPSALTIVLFTHIRDDNRSFILDQLSPSLLEVLGGQSLESTREVLSLIEEFSENFHLSPENLEQLRNLSPDEIEAEIRLIDRGAKEVATEIRSLCLDHLRRGQSISQPNSDEDRKRILPHLSEVDVVTEIERLVRYFDELTGQSAETNFLPPTLVSESGTAVTQKVLIKVGRRPFSRFLATLIATMSAVAKRSGNARLDVAVGSEQIGSGTAALFRGSMPGTYARIVISHKGQSLTPNMLPESVRRVGPVDLSADAIDATLAILSLEVERLNGFFSIQSSPLKGTHLTIYLPTEPIVNDKTRAVAQRKIPTSSLEAAPVKESPAPQPSPTPQSSPSPQPAAPTTSAPRLGTQRLRQLPKTLVVTDDTNLQQELQSIFMDVGITTVELTTRAELHKSLTPPEYSGSGFGAPSASDNLFAQTINIESFGLIIVPILGNLAEGMKVLKQLGPKRPIVVITEDEDSADALGSIHQVLSYPIRREELETLLSKFQVNQLSES